MSFVIEGIDDFREALRNLAPDLAQDAGDLIVEHTNIAAERMVAAYPEGPTGHLKGGVKFSIERSQFGALGIVKNTAQHAYIFEEGTQARHTELGANRGAMPPGHVFVPIMMDERRKVNDGLKTLIQASGLETDGDLE